jgi:glucose/arabinose dehydrogenase/mono/diheme cytochrome c family protein
MPFRFLLWVAVLCRLLVLSAGAAEATHAKLIGAWDRDAFERGRQLYNTLCITCHGSPEKEGTLPTSRPFWKEPFKNGHDPLSLYKTVSEGFGQMPAWTFLTPQQRYDTVHYIREAFVRPLNPGAYFKVDAAYLASLPTAPLEDPSVDGAAPSQQEPPYLRMDFGPALFWTLQVETNNIAYKGIAIRLDDGPGGVSKGHAWMLYDHDTMRVAAAWTGEQFIDWVGIAFDGSHGTHASIVGERAFVNPVGPGWGNPLDGSFADPRFLGRDQKPYGPLPRAWAHYEGVYYHSNKVVVAYTVGEARVLESPSLENGAFGRTLNVSKSRHDLLMRIAPASASAQLVGAPTATILRTNGFAILQIPASATPINLKVLVGAPQTNATPPAALASLTNGSPARWNPPLVTRGALGTNDGAFAIDELPAPADSANPWQTWMRFGGFDFFKDGTRAAICTWNGDVWIVSGLNATLSQLTWKRIASGLFQPLGLIIVDETIYVTCRDQIARLHDLNGDGEIDFIENFNNDHQVTEHFHEFAMGLQTDAAGNFYYAKSARHALRAVVPHHGTLLKVSPDGARTEIVANGFRAANGVCVNGDGTFFVTDQEGHWTPKNRINWVHPGGFYGNMFGYHSQTSGADQDMEQPLVWITNDTDRSPGELVRVNSPAWGKLNGALLSLSYGTGRIFLVPNEKVGAQIQGGVARLPIPEFPTGVMRGRFHPADGHLYACGLFAWAGNRQANGGFYRVRATGQPAWLPIGLRARTNSIEIELSDPIDPTFAANPANYRVIVWGLNRSANYGSKHLDEHALAVKQASVSADGTKIRLSIPDLQPTRGMQITATLRSKEGATFTRTIDNTIHELSPERND